MNSNLVATGRGSYVSRSETSLADILHSYDRAYPDYVDIPRDEVIAAYGAKPLTALSSHQCRWPVNSAGPNELHLFCGDPASDLKPYCAVHWRLAYRSAPTSGATQKLTAQMTKPAREQAAR